MSGSPVVHAESDGGLRQPLNLPTQSIVFKFVDREHVGSGVVAIVASTELDSVWAGRVIEADVTFPDAPPGVELRGRPFQLWLGRDIGNALITSVEGE